METITDCTAVISHTVFRCCCLFIPGTYNGEGVKLWMFLITHLCVYNHPTWHIWKSCQTQISHSFDFIKQYEELKSLWQMVPSLSGQMWDCSQRCSTHLDRSVRIALQHDALCLCLLWHVTGNEQRLSCFLLTDVLVWRHRLRELRVKHMSVPLFFSQKKFDPSISHTLRLRDDGRNYNRKYFGDYLTRLSKCQTLVELLGKINIRTLTVNTSFSLKKFTES